MSNVVEFKGNLPTLNINHFQKALATHKEAKGVSAGDKQFLKLSKNGGFWVYGQNDTEVEEGSRWAINPMTMQTGYIAWKNSKPVGKKLGSIFNPPITADMLDDVGAKWDEAVAFELVCVSGEDVGTLCEYTANSYGGRKAFTDLMDALMKQSAIDADKIVPIIELESSSYEHSQWGLTYNPVLKIVDWGSMAKGAADAGGDDGDGADEQSKQDASQKAPEPEASQRRRRAGPVTDAEPAKTEPETPVRRQRRRAT